MTKVTLAEVYAVEAQRHLTTLTSDLDRLIEDLQTARQRLAPDALPSALTGSMGASLARDLAGVLSTAAQFSTAQHVTAVLKKEQG